MHRILKVAIPGLAGLGLLAYLARYQIPPIRRARIEEAIKQKVGAGLRDPYSAQYKFAHGPGTQVCGTVNAKNSFGAYVGDRPFHFHALMSDDGYVQLIDAERMQELQAKALGEVRAQASRDREGSCDPAEAK